MLEVMGKKIFTILCRKSLSKPVIQLDDALNIQIYYLLCVIGLISVIVLLFIYC